MFNGNPHPSGLKSAFEIETGSYQGRFIVPRDQNYEIVLQRLLRTSYFQVSLQSLKLNMITSSEGNL